MRPPLIVPSLGGLDPSARAIINAFTTPPTPARKALINTTVKSLKAAGVWSLLDSLYILAAADSQAARVDWKRPATTATVTNSPTFAADRGYTFDGSTNYFDTAFTPSTQGVNMTSAVGTWAVWERNSVAAASTYHGGQGTGGSAHRTLIAPKQSASNVVSCSIAGLVTAVGSGMTSNVGLTAVSSSGALLSVHKNGAAFNTAAANSGGTVNRSLWLGGYNAGSLLTPRAVECAACLAGNLQTDALHLSAYTAIAAYMTAVGA